MKLTCRTFWRVRWSQLSESIIRPPTWKTWLWYLRSCNPSLFFYSPSSTHTIIRPSKSLVDLPPYNIRQTVSNCNYDQTHHFHISANAANPPQLPHTHPAPQSLIDSQAHKPNKPHDAPQTLPPSARHLPCHPWSSFTSAIDDGAGARL